MTVELALIVSIVSVAFSIFFGLKNNKRTDTKDIEERVKENTRINLKLDDIIFAYSSTTDNTDISGGVPIYIEDLHLLLNEYFFLVELLHHQD